MQCDIYCRQKSISEKFTRCAFLELFLHFCLIKKFKLILCPKLNVPGGAFLLMNLSEQSWFYKAAPAAAGTGFGALGGGATTGAFGAPAAQQQLQAAAAAPQQATPEAIYASAVRCNVFGDDRDTLVARSGNQLNSYLLSFCDISLVCQEGKPFVETLVSFLYLLATPMHIYIGLGTLKGFLS